MCASKQNNREDKGKKLDRLLREQNSLESRIQKAIQVLHRVETRLVVTSDPMDSEKLKEDRDNLKAQIDELESDFENGSQAIQSEGLEYYSMYLVDLIRKDENSFVNRSCQLLPREETTLKKIKKKYSLDDLEIDQIRDRIFTNYRKTGRLRRFQQIGIAIGVVVSLATACTMTVAVVSSVGSMVTRPSDGWIFLGTIDKSTSANVGFPVDAPLYGRKPISKAVVPRRGEVVSIVIDVNLRTVADDTSGIIRVMSGGESVKIRDLKYFFDPKDNMPNTQEVWAQVYICPGDTC